MAAPSASELNRKIVDQDKTHQECEAIEAELASLRAAYEQYFLGIERRAPSADHASLKKRITQLQGSFIRQTGVKFRVANLHTKFATYERLWLRTIQEMEDGTYHRDVFKAKLHAQKRAAEKAASGSPSAPGAASAANAPSSAPAPAAPSAPPPSAAVLSDAKLRAVFDAYVKAKKRCNEDTSKLSYEAMASTLKKQVPELLKQHKAKSVEFKVVIKDGKAVLRAVPKE